MRALVVQISGLAALGSFFNNLWANASIERALLISFCVGLAVYFILSIGESLLRHIIESKPAQTGIKDANVTSEFVDKEDDAPDKRQPLNAS